MKKSRDSRLAPLQKSKFETSDSKWCKHFMSAEAEKAKCNGKALLRQTKLHLNTHVAVIYYWNKLYHMWNKRGTLCGTERRWKRRIKERLAVRCWQLLKWLTSKADGCYGWRVFVECLHQTVVVFCIQDVDQTIPAGCGQQLQTWEKSDHIITYCIHSQCVNILQACHHYSN